MNQKARVKRLFKEGLWIVTGQVLTLIGTLFQIRVLTEYLTPAVYGELQLALTISGLITATLMAAVTPGIARYYSISAEQGDTSSYLKACKKLMGYATLAICLVGFMLAVILTFLGMAQWILLSILAIVFGVFSSYSGALGSIQNAARKRIIVALHNVADAWFKIAIVVVCISVLGEISIAAALGFLLTAVLITISQLFFIKKLPSPPQAIKRAEVPEDWGRSMLLFSRPFLIWGVFGWMQQSSSRWALGLLSSTDDVGFFSVLYQLGYAPMVMISSLGLTFITPVLFARVGNATDGIRVKNLIRMVFILTSISAILLLIAVWIAVVFHEAIFALAAGAEFKTQSHYLPYMVFAGGLFAISQVLATIPTSLNVPSKLLLASIGSSLIGIAGAFAGAYYYSFEGVVFSLIIHSAAYFILCCLAIKKITNDNLRLGSLLK